MPTPIIVRIGTVHCLFWGVTQTCGVLNKDLSEFNSQPKKMRYDWKDLQN